MTANPLVSRQIAYLAGRPSQIQERHLSVAPNVQCNTSSKAARSVLRFGYMDDLWRYSLQ